MDDDKGQSIGENIKRIRLRQHPRMSREHLAELMSVDPATIYRWETGVSPVDSAKMMKLAEVLSVTIGEIVQDSRMATPPIDIEDVVTFIRQVYQTKQDAVFENSKLEYRVIELRDRIDELEHQLMNYDQRKMKSSVLRSPSSRAPKKSK